MTYNCDTDTDRQIDIKVQVQAKLGLLRRILHNVLLHREANLWLLNNEFANNIAIMWTTAAVLCNFIQIWYYNIIYLLQ